MARPPEGPNLADRLDGPDEAKKRLKVILETISGEKTIEQAATEIGVKPARFHELRKEALEAAVEALNPKPAGRPREVADMADPRVAELEGQLRELEIEVKASHVREQIARTMPHLLKDETAPAEDESLKKKRKTSRVLDRLQKDRKRKR